MIILKIILFILWMAVIPFLIGLFITEFISKHKNSIVLSYVYGMVAEFAVFQILAIPAIFLKMRFTIFVCICAGIFAIFALISLILNIRRLKSFFINNVMSVKRWPWWAAVVIVLILFQAYQLGVNEYRDLDDSFYVATSVTTWETDTMYQYNAYTGEAYSAYPARYILAPFPVFIAMIGKLLFTHPTIIAHSVLPFVFIPMAYGVYWLVGRLLFKDDMKKNWLFLALICILNLFGNQTVYTVSTFLLTRIWQGKAVLAAILLPLIIYVSLKVYHSEMVRADWVMLFGVMLASCMVSSMGVVLAPVELVVFVLTYAFLQKNYMNIWKALICCIPNVLVGVIFLMIR